MAGQYVGIDLHRRRSVVVHKDDAGEVVAVRKIDNNPVNLAAAVMEAGPHSDVILEATYGWYWAADLLAELGCDVHLAAPSSLNWGQRRVKNDVRDAIDLIDLYRLGRMTEAWIAPPRTRELRELVRYRLKLTGLRTGLKAQLHAVMAKNGVLPARNDMFGPGGRAQLAALELPDAYMTRITSIQRLVDVLSTERRALDAQLRRELHDDPGYRAVQAIEGVDRSSRPCSWPRSVTSPGSVHRRSCVRGLGSHPSIASPTPKSCEARSPSKDHGWCGGRPSKRSVSSAAAPSCVLTSTPSLPAAANRKPTLRSLGSC